MHIVVDAQPDPQRYAAAFRQLLRPAFLRIRLLGLIILLLGLVLLLIPPHNVVPGVVFVVLGPFFAIFVPIRSIRASTRGLPLTLQQPQRFELTEQSVRVFTPLVFSEYSWGAFVKTQEIPGMLLLMLSRRQTIPVPLDGVPPQQLAELREFVANRAFLVRQ